MGPLGCPETSVRNYHYLLRNSSSHYTLLILPFQAKVVLVTDRLPHTLQINK
jgi:hypothetical protein